MSRTRHIRNHPYTGRRESTDTVGLLGCFAGDERYDGAEAGEDHSRKPD